MQKIIISDTSCLIILSKIKQLHLLKLLYNEILITPEIADELGEPLPVWIRIKNPRDITYQNIISATLDKGEASIFALALDYTDCLLVLDDYKARRFADKLKLKYTGTYRYNY